MIGIIFGPPGSGKGTQASRIEEEFKLKHLSTGSILRHEVALGTPTGKEAGRIMAAGDLVPDELIVDIVRGRLPEAEAETAGVLLGDVLLKIADRNCGEEGISSILSSLAPGQGASIAGIRGGQQFTSMIQIGERPRR